MAQLNEFVLLSDIMTLAQVTLITNKTKHRQNMNDQP
jgi:hypothetical protein